MSASNRWIIFIVFFPVLGYGQLVTTYDTRTGGVAVVSQYPARDVGVIDNMDTHPWMRSIRAPALIEMATKTMVPITGTVVQAFADLQRVEADRPVTPERTLLIKLTQRLVKDGELTDDEARIVADIIPPFVPGKTYKSNDLVRVDGGLASVAEDSIKGKPITIRPITTKPIDTKPIFDEPKNDKDPKGR